MIRYIGKTFVFLFIIIGSYEVFGQDNATAIPIKIINGLPYIEATINEKGPFLFGFDSGFGAQLELDADLAAALQITVTGQTIIGDGSGQNEVTVETATVNKVAIGNFQAQYCTALLRTNARKNIPGMENVKGIIGIGMFPKHLITIDYPKQLFSISNGGLPKANTNDIFDYESVGGGIPQLKIQVGNYVLNAVVDTRSMSGTFKIPQEIAEKLNFISTPKLVGKGRTISNTIDINEVQIGEAIKIGSFVFEQPVITYPSLNENAIIGSKFLQSFAIIIDTKNQRIQLKKGPEVKKDEQLTIYEGQFGDRTFTVEGNALYVQRPGGQKLKMQQKETDTFTLEIVPNAILKFERNAFNAIHSVKVSKGDGVWETANKTS